MTNPTDVDAYTGVVSASRVLTAVAEHLTAVRPSEPMDVHTLPFCIGVEAYQLGGSSISGDASTAARTALAEAPAVPEPITRGEYALHLRRHITAHGYDWSEDDNRPVIPQIPGPRQEPCPKGGRAGFTLGGGR